MMTIKTGDGVVFRLWDTNGRTRGYAAAVVRGINDKSVSITDIHSTVDTTRANGSLSVPTWVFEPNILLITSYPQDARDLSDKLNELSQQEAEVLAWTPQRYEQLRQDAIIKAQLREGSET